MTEPRRTEPVADEVVRSALFPSLWIGGPVFLVASLALARLGLPDAQPAAWGLLVAAAVLFGAAWFVSRKRALGRERDLTERFARERAALQASERRLRDAQRIAHVGSFEWDIESDRLVWSDEHYRIFGWEPGEPVDNRRFISAVHPEDRARLVRNLARSLREGGPVEMEFRVLRPDGEERIVLGRGETRHDDSGRAIRHSGTSYDITAKHRVEEALRASETRLVALLTAMDATRAVAIGRDGRISMLVGPWAAQHERYGIGESDVQGHGVLDLLPDETGERVLAAVARVYDSGEREELALEEVALPTGRFHFDVSLRPLRSADDRVDSVLAIVRDVTQRQAEAEAQQRARRLESLGVLAGGIAHDFNNLLVGILANAELARDRAEPNSALSKELDDIFSASARAAELIQELLVHAGAARLSLEPVDLASLVSETARLLGPALSPGVRVRVEPVRGPVWTHGDAAQIRQVVMNFITNAAEAMEGRPGVVTVCVETAWLGASELEPCFVGAGLAPGRYCRIEVCDSGVGMDRQTLDRIFDPFFTTKRRGRGLGLASTVGIVRAHRGALRAESLPGRGTVLGVLLPNVEPVETAERPDAPRQRQARETILVVDDEDLVRQAAARLLESEGYRVIEAASGSRALDVLKVEGAPVDLALVDLTMPEMDGEQTFEALRGVDPELPVVFMSGHSSEELALRTAGKRRAAHLTKPFRRAALRRALASLLEPERDAGPG